MGMGTAKQCDQGAPPGAFAVPKKTKKKLQASERTPSSHPSRIPALPLFAARHHAAPNQAGLQQNKPTGNHSTHSRDLLLLEISSLRRPGLVVLVLVLCSDGAVAGRLGAASSCMYITLLTCMHACIHTYIHTYCRYGVGRQVPKACPSFCLGWWDLQSLQVLTMCGRQE
jgi:hypothetical protein